MELAFAGLHHLCAPMLDGMRHAAGAPAGRAGGGVRAAGRERAGPLPRGPGGPEPAGRSGRGAPARVPRRRRALARSRLRAGARLRRPPPAGRAHRDGVRRARADATVDELAGLPELRVEGLAAADARSLLESVVPGRVDARVRDRILAETRGNPLALLELPRGLTPAELAGGFGLPDARPLASRIEQTLPRARPGAPARHAALLLTAAAEPLGDSSLLWRAAERLGIGRDAGRPAEAAELIELGLRVRFKHPLVRSAVYRAADPERPPRRAPGARGGDRPGRRSRPARVASRARDGDARRGGGRRDGALGRPRAAPRRAGGGRRVPASARPS